MSIDLVTRNEPVEDVVLFTLDGVPYGIPNKVRVNLQLVFLKKLRTEGEQLAGSWLVEVLVGEEAYDALCTHEDLTAEDFEQVMDAARKVVFGELEVPKAKPNRAARRSGGSRAVKK